MHYKHAIAAGAVGFALVLTGCGNSSDGSSSTSSSSTKASFNKADVSFAQDMIPHHRQAVEMARLASTRASDPKVKALASDIEAAQGPEIETMSGWLKDWNQKVSPDMSGMDDGEMGSSMPEMMSDADMTSLERSTGAAFDTQFLTIMVAHHQGAIEMARTEQSEGKNAPATELAKQIETAQTGEIKTMQDLLAS